EDRDRPAHALVRGRGVVKDDLGAGLIGRGQAGGNVNVRQAGSGAGVFHVFKAAHMTKLIEGFGKLVVNVIIKEQCAGNVVHEHGAWIGVAERWVARRRWFVGARLLIARASNQQTKKHNRRCTFETDSHIAAIKAALAMARAACLAAWFESYRSFRRAPSRACARRTRPAPPRWA